MATKRYNFKFHCLKDKDIIDRIDSQENKQNYIRGLILSDIAADILRDSIILNQDQDQDQDKYIDTDIVYQERVNWFNEHCPAVGDPDYDCTGCFYFKHHKDDPYSDAGYCDAQSYFEKDMARIREYFKAGGALRDYPAEFKGLKRKTLNSFYGAMIKDPFKDDVIDNMMEEKSDGKLQKP